MIRNLLTLLVFILILIGCNENTDISAEKVKQLMDSGRFNGVILLDVRTPEEYADKHIIGSINIPIESLEEKSNELNKNESIIVYCKSGCNRSLTAYRLLKQKGFSRIKNMVGGINEWCRIGGKIEGSCPTKMPEWELGKGCES